MDRLSYIGTRLLHLIPILLGISVLVFLLIHLIPGDPARVLLGPHAPATVVAAQDRAWGLDQPLLAQFINFLGSLLRGNLGTSLTYREPVVTLLASRLAATLWLLISASIITVVITLPLAVAAAMRPNSWIDHAIRLIPLVGLGMPAFWVGIILLLVLAESTGWFPVGGFGTDFLGHLHAIVLPALTVALGIAPITVRSLRAAMLEVLQADFVTTARAKGLSERRVILAHVLRNAIIPTITVFGLNIGWLVGNTLVVEKVFALPGIGALMLDSILSSDFPVVQAIALVFAILVVVVSTSTDILRSMVDPRVKLG
jgi:peptide/nickel transport system permease protein